MMLRQLIIFTCILSCFLGFYQAHAQTVSFAADIKENGELINPASTFAVTKKGGNIKMMVNLGHKVNATRVVYKVFRVSDKGDQYPDATIEDEVEPEWLWFYHDLLVRGPGNYMVYVYRKDDPEIIASGLVKIVPAP